MKYSITKRPKRLRFDDTVRIDGIEFSVRTCWLRANHTLVSSQDYENKLREWLGGAAYARLVERSHDCFVWPTAFSYAQLTRDVNEVFDAIAKKKKPKPKAFRVGDEFSLKGSEYQVHGYRGYYWCERLEYHGNREEFTAIFGAGWDRGYRTDGSWPYYETLRELTKHVLALQKKHGC